MKAFIRRALFALLLFFCGCAALGVRITDITFEDPLQRLGIVSVPANAEEQMGVRLRVVPPASNILQAREETTMYALIPQRPGQGLQVKLTGEETSTYAPGSRPDSWVVRTESRIGKSSGDVLDKNRDELEITDRNEIVRLIRSVHDTKAGKFTVTSWTRSPALPEHPVKIGDSWHYQEAMTLALDPKDPPSRTNYEATSKLAGFATVKGRRCAVIETEVKTVETQRTKVLFRDRVLYNRAKARETTFLDYRAHTRVAAITGIETDTNSADGKIDLHSVARSVRYLV